MRKFRLTKQQVRMLIDGKSLVSGHNRISASGILRDELEIWINDHDDMEYGIDYVIVYYPGNGELVVENP